MFKFFRAKISHDLFVFVIYHYFQISRFLGHKFTIVASYFPLQIFQMFLHSIFFPSKIIILHFIPPKLTKTFVSP